MMLRLCRKALSPVLLLPMRTPLPPFYQLCTCQASASPARAKGSHPHCLTHEHSSSRISQEPGLSRLGASTMSAQDKAHPRNTAAGGPSTRKAAATTLEGAQDPGQSQVAAQLLSFRVHKLPPNKCAVLVGQLHCSPNTLACSFLSSPSLHLAELPHIEAPS